MSEDQDSMAADGSFKVSFVGNLRMYRIIHVLRKMDLIAVHNVIGNSSVGHWLDSKKFKFENFVRLA